VQIFDRRRHWSGIEYLKCRSKSAFLSGQIKSLNFAPRISMGFSSFRHSGSLFSRLEHPILFLLLQKFPLMFHRDWCHVYQALGNFGPQVEKSKD
jgi:hypothetical protein